MASVYDKNMESMKKRYPYYANKIQDRYTKEYKVESGVEHIEDRTVLYTLYNDKQYQLDSLYESEALIDLWYRDYKNDDLYNVYAVFGLGNGMFIRKLIEGSTPDKDMRIVVYEPNLSILKTVLREFDITDILDNINVHLYIKELDEDPIGVLLDDVINYRNVKNVHVAQYPNYSLFFENEFAEFNNAIRINKEAVNGSMDANEKFGRAFYNNIFDNLNNYLDSKSIASLKKKLPEGFPVIIVSSGPSLSKNITELKNAKNKALIVAVDSAMPILLHEDIIPDMYASIDGMKFLAHFEDEKTKDIPVLTTITATPGAIRDGQTAFFEKGDNRYINAFLEKENIDVPELSTGGTVANTAYKFAEYLEPGCIILCGQDLAYTGDKAHADNSLSDNNEIEESTLTYTKDIYGNDVKTSVEFTLYKDWFEREIKQNKIRTVDATEGGALIEGTEIKTLKDIIDEECKQEFDVSACIEDCDGLFNNDLKAGMLSYMKSVPEKLDGILSDIQRSKINYDKMYLMAKANDLSKDELTRLFKENDDINNRVNNEPVMAIVEYLIQDSIRRMNDNANKTSDDVRTEIMEAGSIGRDHAAAIAEKSLWIKEDLQKRFED